MKRGYKQIKRKPAASGAKMAQCALTFIAAAAILLVSGRELLAQEKPAAPKRVKLEELIQEALDRNRLVRAAKFEALSSEAAIDPVGAYDDPFLTFSAMNFPVDTFSNNRFAMTGWQVSLTQAFPFPGKLGKLKRAARFEYESKKEEFSVKQLEVIRDVKLAYYDLFLAHKRKEILEEQKNVIEQLIVVTRNKYTLGQISQAELVNLQVEEAELIEQTLKAEARIEKVIGELNHLLGRLEHAHRGGMIPEDLKRTPINFKKLTQEELTKTVLAANPEVRSRQAEFRATEARVSYAYANFFPDLQVGASYTFRSPTNMEAGTDLLSAHVGITLPIYALTRQSGELKSARADQIRSEALLDQARIHLAHQVHVLYAELVEAHKRLNLFESGVLPLARQAVVVGRSAYLARKLEYSALLDSIEKRFEAEFSYNDALAQYESRVAQLEFLMAKPVTEVQGVSKE